MSLNTCMNGTQYMGYHCITKFYKTSKFNLLCCKTSKCNVKWAGSRYIAFL